MAVAKNVRLTMPHRTDSLHIRIMNYKPLFPHDPKKKRRLLPAEKDDLKRLLRGKSAYAARSQLADAIVVDGLPVPAHMPTLNTLRKAKSSDQCPENRDVFDGLHDLFSIHVDCVQNIGNTPFYVFYTSPSQIEWYAKEKSANKRSIISIDATGVGMKSPTTFKKYIFLYVICAHGESRL